MQLHLHKGIPVAGGMAGGSADAAAALVACDALWGTGLARAELLELAAELGSDVPFALVGGTALGTGRGERLTPVLARGRFDWVLALADGGLSTPAVYAECDRLRGRPRAARAAGAPTTLMAALRAGDAHGARGRAAQRPAAGGVSLRPALRQTLRDRRGAGALGGIVSGSGPDRRVPRAGATEHALDIAVALSATRHLPVGEARFRARTRARWSTGGRLLGGGREWPATSSTSRTSASPTAPAPCSTASRLGVAEGDRIGVVGRNGDGKSTLLRMLARHRAPDTGRVTHAGGLRVGVGRRSTTSCDPTRPCARLVVGDGPGARVGRGRRGLRDVLAGLFGDRAALDAMLDRVVGPLSGGERRRVALARPLVGEHDLLVLDEPTNHLDVEGIAWLARHLLARREALVVVTHDRWFLDEVCTRTWEVQGGSVCTRTTAATRRTCSPGPSATGCSRRPTRGGRNLVRKELAWLRRGPPARTSKPRFRIDAANALIADEPPPRDGVELMRFASARLGKTVYDLQDVTLAGRRDRTLLDRLTWQVGPGDRIGIVGVNGSGKTSLLRLLVGRAGPGRRARSCAGSRCGRRTCRRRSPSSTRRCGCWRRSRWCAARS